MSEIDDIFAGKAKGKAAVPSGKVVPSAEPAASAKKGKKKKKKQPKAASDTPDTTSSAAPVASSSKKRPAPETIVDTSHTLAGPAKRHKGNDSKQSPKKVADPDAAFKDSRGTSDRRKTEEGWLVYKEDELGIGDDGGGELLCVPSFSHCTAAFNQTHRYVRLIVIVVFKIYHEQYTRFAQCFPSRFLYGSFEASRTAFTVGRGQFVAKIYLSYHIYLQTSSLLWRCIAIAQSGIHSFTTFASLER